MVEKSNKFIEFIKNNKSIIFLSVIFLIAVFFRFWRLGSIPPGLYPDEAINANDAITSPGKIFYPENNGREGLFINLLYFSSLILGKSIFSMRFVSAFFGSITVIGIFLMTREIFRINDNSKAENIALLASFFTAVSFWHINFSRIVFRAILIPLILTFSFYFLFKGFKEISRGKKNIYPFIISGIIFGLGFYTYIAFRLSVLLLGLCLVLFYFFFKGKESKKRFVISTLVLLLFCFIIALPIGIYFLNNPSYFVSRAGGVSVFSQNNILKSFTESILRHLAMFNFSGDYNWRHNISGSPILFWPVGILFLIGISLSIFKLKLKKKSYPNFLIYSFLIGWFLIMLLPGALTYESMPHALRVIGVIPSIFIFSALGSCFLKDKLRNIIKKEDNVYWLIVISLIILSISFISAQYSRYFITWGKNSELKGAFSESYVDVGKCLNTLSSETEKFVIVNQPGVPVPYPEGIPVSAQTTMFIERTEFEKPRASYIIPNDIGKIVLFTENNPEKEIEILLLCYDENLIFDLWKKFPQGNIEIKNKVWVYTIN